MVRGLAGQQLKPHIVDAEQQLGAKLTVYGKFITNCV